MGARGARGADMVRVLCAGCTGQGSGAEMRPARAALPCSAAPSPQLPALCPVPSGDPCLVYPTILRRNQGLQSGSV